MAIISEPEWTRYERQLMIQGWDRTVQERLNRSTVFIAGAGGLGGPVLTYLALAGVGTLRVCDRDAVDLSNLNRQILHTEERLHMRKVDSASIALRQANPYVRIVPLHSSLTKANAEELIADSEVIMDCLDNFEARQILNVVSVGKRIPMIHAGASGFRGQISFLHPPETPCLRCITPFESGAAEVPIVGCVPGVVGSLQAVECIKYLTGLGELLRNKILFWDAEIMEFHVEEVRKNPQCKICGHYSDG